MWHRAPWMLLTASACLLRARASTPLALAFISQIRELTYIRPVSDRVIATEFPADRCRARHPTWSLSSCCSHDPRPPPLLPPPLAGCLPDRDCRVPRQTIPPRTSNLPSLPFFRPPLLHSSTRLRAAMRLGLVWIFKQRKAPPPSKKDGRCVESRYFSGLACPEKQWL